MIYETFREAIQNIWSNKFRTFLTMLGIIIGVTAVIVIVGLGNGMTQSIQSSFSDLGTNIISVQVMGYGSRSVKVEDVYSLVDAHPDLFEAVSPTASINGTVKVGTTSYSNTSVKGVSESYLGMSGYTVRVGRGINYVDLTDNKKICVVGDYISRVAYGGNAVGQTIKIGAEKYTIVGVLEAKVTDTSDQEGSSDDIVLLPYTTALRVSQTSTASSYAVTVTSEDNISEAKTALEDGLQELLSSDKGYMVTSMSEMLDMMTSMVNMVVTILTAIAAISLLVGGIGIPRDRHSQGAGCQGTGHSGPVRHRSCHHLGAGRHTGHRSWLSALGTGKQDPAAGHVRYGNDRGTVSQLGGRGLWHLGGHRRAVRLPACKARGTAQPHRSAALRLRRQL